MQRVPKRKILVSLDCILDTRLGTIGQHDDRLASQVLKNNYHTRESDIFPELNGVDFATLYAARDVETLKHSTVTGCLPLLNHICKELQSEAIKAQVHAGAEVVLNLYPYDIPEKLQSLIELAVVEWLGDQVTVSSVNLSPEQVTPFYCLDDFAVLIMYDYRQWLEMHLEAMEKHNLRHVILFVPGLYFEIQPTAEQMETLLHEAPHPFISLEVMVKPAIDLSIIGVKYFSIFQPGDLFNFEELNLTQAHPQTAS